MLANGLNIAVLTLGVSFYQLEQWNEYTVDMIIWQNAQNLVVPPFKNAPLLAMEHVQIAHNIQMAQHDPFR